MNHFTLFLAVLLCIVLLHATVSDLRSRIIPNWLNASIALAAPLWWWALGMPLWPDIAIQVGMSLLVFGIFVTLFALGMMGGGDVKLLAALALWLSPFPFGRMLFVMALAGGVVTIGTVIIHRLGKKEGNPEIPYGVAISFAAIWVFANDLLTIPHA